MTARLPTIDVGDNTNLRQRSHGAGHRDDKLRTSQYLSNRHGKVDSLNYHILRSVYLLRSSLRFCICTSDLSIAGPLHASPCKHCGPPYTFPCALMSLRRTKQEKKRRERHLKALKKCTSISSPLSSPLLPAMKPSWCCWDTHSRPSVRTRLRRPCRPFP